MSDDLMNPLVSEIKNILETLEIMLQEKLIMS